MKTYQITLKDKTYKEAFQITTNSFFDAMDKIEDKWRHFNLSRNIPSKAKSLSIKLIK